MKTVLQHICFKITDVLRKTVDNFFFFIYTNLVLNSYSVCNQKKHYSKTQFVCKVKINHVLNNLSHSLQQSWNKLFSYIYI